MKAIQEFWFAKKETYRFRVLEILSVQCTKILTQQNLKTKRPLYIFMNKRQRPNEDDDFRTALQCIHIPDTALAPKFEAFLHDCFEVGLDLQDVWLNVQQLQLQFSAIMLSLLKVSPSITN
jgi:hypothetical protein